jgi:hypothetical protein
MYAIRKTRHFFGPKIEKSYVTDGFQDDARAEFKTRAEADALVKQLDQAVYYTAHNESGRPEYKVVRVK